ncbi:hypothetical protein KAU43_05045 [candidate division WOR-3 bacterium]|nr:hypothetical protein [candidate division WOR-3 bacterium]
MPIKWYSWAEKKCPEAIDGKHLHTTHEDEITIYCVECGNVLGENEVDTMELKQIIFEIEELDSGIRKLIGCKGIYVGSEWKCSKCSIDQRSSCISGLNAHPDLHTGNVE